MSKLAIKERTFGLEMEYADMVKSMVHMPVGWGWDEEEVITNTDGTRGTPNGKVGGEINTAPMKVTSCLNRADLKKVCESVAESNAKPSRDNGLDVHIGIADLDLDELKRIFYLSYWATPVLRQMCKQAVYADEQRYYPAPDLSHYLAAKKAATIEQLRSVFEDNSKKGFTRFFVNIASYFVRGTVEFRCFNATCKYDDVMTCVMFAYRFVDYAITHTEEDFRQLKDVATFCKRLKVKDNLPDIETAPIFFASVASLNAGNTLHKSVSVNSQFARMICDLTGKEIITVNPQTFTFENRLRSAGKKVIVYNNDEFNHIIYELATGQLKLSYSGDAKVLDKYISDSPADQIACVLTLVRIAKYFRDSEYHINELGAILQKMDETMGNMRVSAQKIIDTLETSDYRLGTLNDAIANGGDIFFNFDEYRKNRSAVSTLKSYTDYAGTFEKKTTQYYHVEQNLPAGTRLILLSEYEYLSIPKVAQIGKNTLYCTEDKAGKIVHKAVEEHPFSFIPPPNDLDVTDPSKLKINRISGSDLLYLQRQYIKKVDKVTASLYAYVVLYDGYLLGGFGFNLPKNTEYDMWLLSDFCTNNEIPRLSKLILLCIQSEPVRRSLCRHCKRAISTIYTKIYTHNPVSMKYRGIFKKVAQEPSHLVYDSRLGESGTIEDVMRKYNEIKSRKK